MANPFQGDDQDDFSGVRDEEGNIKRDAPKEEPNKTFKQAFAAARKDGDKTFEFEGKKYTTELAKPKAESAKTTSKADTSRANEVPPGPKQKTEDKTKSAKTADEKKFGVFGAKGKNPSPANPSKYKKGGSVKSSASKRADGIATKGKTKGRIV